jgi:hypothetical protein
MPSRYCGTPSTVKDRNFASLSPISLAFLYSAELRQPESAQGYP